MKKNILPIILIALINIFVWHKILFQALLGEGYYYFDPGQNFFRSGFALHPLSLYLANYDNLPRLIFDILPPLFRDNLILYQGFQLLTLILLSITLFLVVNDILKNKWLSFMATFLFSTSYVGLFEMIATGNYQRFIQRIPNFIFLLIAFWQLAKYFKTQKRKHYLFSLIIFSLTIFMAHYSTFLLPLFIAFPLIEFLVKRKKLSRLPRYLGVSLSFFLINYFLIKNDFYHQQTDFLSIFSNKTDSLNLILLQVSHTVYPPTFLTQIAKVAQPDTKTTILLSIPAILVYLVGIYLVKKKEPKYLTLYLTSVITVFSILFLNSQIGKVDYGTFVRGDRYYFVPVEILNQLGVSYLGGSRYYVLPMMFNAIIFSIIFWVLLKKSKLFYSLSGVLLFFYLIYNSKLVWRETGQIQPVSERMKIYLSYTKSIADKLKKAEVVATPPEFIWAGQFVRLFYGNEDLRFVPLKDGWQKEIDQETLKQTIVLGFDEEVGKIHEKKY